MPRFPKTFIIANVIKKVHLMLEKELNKQKVSLLILYINLSTWNTNFLKEIPIRTSEKKSR